MAELTRTKIGRGGKGGGGMAGFGMLADLPFAFFEYSI